MRSGRLSVAVAAVVFAMTAVVGCDSTRPISPPPATSSEASATPSPTTESPSPTPASDSEAAAANAESVVRDYYAVVDDLRSDASASLTDLDAVSVSIATASSRRLIEKERSGGWHQTGRTSLVLVDLKGVDLANTDADGEPAPLVQLDVCIDVADVDLLDATGASVTAPGRPTRGWERHTVINHDWSTDPSGGWRVSTIETLDQPPCDANG